MMGRIFDIQRFCVHDGPGIRTTVFMKGCYLRCLWCHNPESWEYEQSLSWMPSKCIACEACVPECPEGALRMVTNKAARRVAALDREKCTVCGKCAAACEPKALEMVGRDVTVEDVMAVVLRDLEYYTESGGGMTLSGGDPLFQPDFSEALLKEAKKHNLHCCVETSGFADWADLERLVPCTDLFLYDWKETNPELHESFTGRPNDRIRDNLKKLHATGAKIVVRCPMIPEYNARAEHLDGIAALSRELPDLVGVELLPYHRLGRAKLLRFGVELRMPESVEPPGRATVESWLRHLGRKGIMQIRQSQAAEAVCREFPNLCRSI